MHYLAPFVQGCLGSGFGSEAGLILLCLGLLSLYLQPQASTSVAFIRPSRFNFAVSTATNEATSKTFLIATVPE